MRGGTLPRGGSGVLPRVMQRRLARRIVPFRGSCGTRRAAQSGNRPNSAEGISLSRGQWEGDDAARSQCRSVAQTWTGCVEGRELGRESRQ
jgi:hypothetical protein